jgi:hypothetical protein
MSKTVAAPIPYGATDAPTDEAVARPDATGAAVTVVVVPATTDDNSVPPIAALIVLRTLNAPIFAAGKTVHSAHVFNDERLVARLYRLKN